MACLTHIPVHAFLCLKREAIREAEGGGNLMGFARSAVAMGRAPVRIR